MKQILIIVILLNVYTFSIAETNSCTNTIKTIEYPVDFPESEIGHVTFYGVLDIWETPAGAVIINCNPPFLSQCFTLFWATDNPSVKTVRLNDDNQTEISVISEPVITTGENGVQIHTFTR